MSNLGLVTESSSSDGLHASVARWVDPRARSDSWVDTPPPEGYGAMRVISEDEVSLLIYWRDQFTRGYFAIGDITNLIIERIGTGEGQLSRDDIYKAVGKVCGKAGRTVRYYAETSAFYPDEVRERYNALPFSHFVFARTTGEYWQDILDYALLHLMATREMLEVHYLGLVASKEIMGGDQSQSREISQNLDGLDVGDIAEESSLDVVEDKFQADKVALVANYSQGRIDEIVASASELLRVAELLELDDSYLVDLRYSVITLRRIARIVGEELTIAGLNLAQEA